MPKARSKFVHAYLDEPKEKFADVPALYTDGDNTGNMTASTTMLAMAKSGAGGPVLVTPLTKYCRWVGTTKYIATQNFGKICNSLEFNPHNPQLLAMGSDSGLIDLVNVPAEGLGSAENNITEADVRLEQHNKKVQYMAWNKHARNVLASSSFDRDLAFWDAEMGVCNQYMEHVCTMAPTSLEWSSDGRQIIYGSKDPTAFLVDPRASDVVTTFKGFNGKKPNKFFFMPSFGWIGGLGTNQGNRQCIKIWDQKNMDQPIFKLDLAVARNKSFPVWDDDIQQLFVWAKGTTQVQHFEVTDQKKKMKLLNAHQTPGAAQFKAGCFAPKRAVDTHKHEIQAFYACYKGRSSPNIVSRLSIITPRKAQAFQKDLFPPSWNGEPAVEGGDWFKGENADLVKASMDPADAADVVKVVRKTYKELLQENEELRARLAKYEKEPEPDM